MKPQSYSLIAAKESFKLLISSAANNGFKLASLDIKAAFLQSKALDRDVFIKPPVDIEKRGFVWRMKKLLNGLDNASKEFWLHIKEILVEMGLHMMGGDEAFFYLHKDGIHQGAVFTYLFNIYIFANLKYHM